MGTATVSVTLPGTAYNDAWEVIAEHGHPDDGNYTEESGALYAAYDRAWPCRSGRNWRYVVTLDRVLLPVLREQMQYRWEINGGGGDPYGVARDGEGSGYAAARRSCKVALDRIDKVMK